MCVFFPYKNKREEEGDERLISLPSNHPVYCLGNKKGENRKGGKKGTRREPVLCAAEHTDAPLGSLTVAGRTGVFADVECEASLLGTKCCLWWELLQ